MDTLAELGTFHQIPEDLQTKNDQWNWGIKAQRIQEFRGIRPQVISFIYLNQ